MKITLNKNKSYIVAEIGWNFLGNLTLAKKMILSAKRSGADAVKFQIWNPKNLKKGPWDKDGRRELYEKSYLDRKKYKNLYKFSKKNKINCFASVWSIDDLKTLSSVSKEIVKIPSPEAYNLNLIKEALKNFKKVILSVGCLNKNELKKLFQYKKNNKLIILHCVSAYPLKPEDCNFKKFHYLKKIFKNVGYSGHMNGIEDAIYALANKAVVIEKHFTINKKLPGRDNKFSLNEKDLSAINVLREKFYNFNINKGLGIQKKEKDIFKNYRGRWQG